MISVAQAARRQGRVVSRIASKADETGFMVAFGRCDSPIEQAYCLEVFQVPGVRAIEGDFGPDCLTGIDRRTAQITVFAQQRILRYRADFLLVGTAPTSAEPVFVIVECDGEAFHSEREQRRRDALRQAELQRTGFLVVRFSGAEIYRKPDAVISRTLEAFSPHGWNALDTSRWLRNPHLWRALAELRAAAASLGVTATELPSTQTETGR